MRVHDTLQAVLTDDVKKLLDQFRECFGIRIVFYDSRGELLKAGLDQPDCRYCQLVQRLCGPGPCLEANACGRKAALAGGMANYVCHAGLREATIPLFCNGYLLGFAMIGQIRTSREMPRPVRLAWRERHANDDLHKAFRALQPVSPRRFEAILDLFHILVNYIVTNHLVSLRVDPSLLEVVEYMRRRLHEPLSLEAVAHRFGRSPSALSRAIKKQLGVSFKRMLVEMRLARAEELMEEAPHTTVAQVAECVGYDDPFYFSRLYTRHRGRPPSEYLARRRPDIPVGG